MSIQNLFLAVAGAVAYLALAILPLNAHSANYLLVVQGPEKDPIQFETGISQAGGQIVANLEEIGVVLATSDNPDFIQAVKSIPFVQQAVNDLRCQWLSPQAQMVLADDLKSPQTPVEQEPFNDFQWNLRQIGADKTAAAGYLGNGVVRARVAVLDNGLETGHPDIAANVNLGLCQSFVPGEGVAPLLPGFNHGTHVAGIIGASINGMGIQGVAPQAEIVAVKVISEDGAGDFGWLLQGILYAIEIQADIVNLSLGSVFPRVNAGGEGYGPLIAALQRAINHATASGVLVITSVGNNALDLDGIWWSIPAQCGHAMAVSATGPIGWQDYDRLASYSNYGHSVVHVAAPGGDFTVSPEFYGELDMVLSLGGFDEFGVPAYFFAAGTSMAAPHVSGLAALLVGHYGHLPPSQLRAMIQHSADDILKPGADVGSGHGRINAWNALLQCHDTPAHFGDRQ